MTGINELSDLLENLKPELIPGNFVFVSVEVGADGLEGLDPILTFHENEGLTLVLRRDAAEAAGLRYEGVWRQITLSVHSALEAVGLLARVTSALAEVGIPCNAVSAFYHDHLFVPIELAEKAMRRLEAIR